MSKRQSKESWEDSDKKVRGPNIPDEWRQYIVELAIDMAQPRKPRMLLADQILEQMQGSRDIKDRLPEKESIAKIISTARNHPVSELDKPWSTATLDQHPIPPEALPVVLKVWKSRIERGEGFTIREAKWVSLLSAFQQDMEKLSRIALRHAHTELMYELIGQPFDSTHLDRLLMGLSVTLTTPRSLLPFLAEQEDGLDQIRELAKGKSKKLHIHRTGTSGTVKFHDREKGGKP